MKKINIYFIVLFLVVITQLMFPAKPQSLQEMKNQAWRVIDRENPLMIEVSDAFWEFAEIALQEYRSAKYFSEVLKKKGFSVEEEVAGLPTAFVASYGSGKPVIGILAEYDALPGLSQDSTTYKKALVEGNAGHGCGHNLFGAGSLGAALALKEVMETFKLSGTIRLYGCPAEEDIGGKMYMAREGLFDDLDASLAWHPGDQTTVDVQGSQAIDDLEIEFFGKTSHAAFDPWKGYSALDAVEMATFGVNLLREHVKPSVRIHYVVTHGGVVPNIVPEHAKLWLWVRDSTRSGVKVVVTRIEEIVKGAAIATRTTPKINYMGSYHEMNVNLAGSEAMQENLKKIGSILYTEEEMVFARKIQKETGVEEKGMAGEIKELEKPANDPAGGSTDVAEVSWITPTVHISTACAPFGIPWHSWAVVTSSKHSVGYKGMFLAAKVMVATALDFLLDKELLSRMKKEFREDLGDYKYKTGLQPGQKPPIREKK